MKTRELTMEEKHDIVKLKKEGKTIRAISEALGIANTTVWNILHKHATTGLLTTKHRTGRPRKTSAGDDRTIVRAVKKNPQVTVGSITNTLLLAGVNVSQSTVRRRLREQKYHFRYISYVPLLAGPEPNDSETRDDKLKEEQLESRKRTDCGYDISSDSIRDRPEKDASCKESVDESQLASV